VRAAALLLALALAFPASAAAKGKPRGARAPRATTSTSAPVERAPSKAEKAAPVSAEGSADGDAGGEATTTNGKSADGKSLKTKTYTFGAMDVEGKLKTPQLLYFLNRVKLELDMSAPDKRSFMKELARSADDKSL
jgi:hypothetical protein